MVIPLTAITRQQHRPARRRRFVTRIKKEASTKKKKYTLQQCGCIYLLVNCIFLLPTVLIRPLFVPLLDMLYHHLPDFALKLLDGIGMVFLVWWIPLILYYIFRLMYLHFALSLGFLVFSIYRLTKEKNKKRFVLVLLLTIISAALNFYWLTHGRPYTIV